MKYCRSFMVHFSLLFFVVLLFLPLYLAFIAASHDAAFMLQKHLTLIPGKDFLPNLMTVLTKPLSLTGGTPIWRLLANSLCMALFIAVGKIILALLSAFALVYFEFPYKKFFFALILLTMMLPVEVRIMPTFQIAASLGLLNSFPGLTLPLLASATATFLFRQFFKTVPKELVEAAKLDGAGPMAFFKDILLPLSKTQIIALFIILFVFGWNQYLWPLLITTDTNMSTIVMGIHYLTAAADEAPQWHLIMTIALIALFPPCFVVIALQRFFEKGIK
ncbi:MAG: sn-glycerol-3-phosphate ABC transporter permease UgpE [Proteobacteria bacterium]|nr:sn-glycerol-3-phosphate ABC transporter permease UgpE [Pseudomonadota bacterium]